MRKEILQVIGPLVDGFAADLVDLIITRVEGDIERASEALAVALSSFASELTDADADRSDHDPVPRVRRRAKRELPLAQDAEVPRPAQTQAPRREQGQRATGLVAENIRDKLLLASYAPVVERDLKPDNVPHVTSKGTPRERAVMKCGKCGELGKRSDGCGTSHNVSGKEVPHGAAGLVRSAASPNRLAAITARANPVIATTSMRTGRVAPPELDEETATAESQKWAGMLPTPSSSYSITHRSTGGLADVAERIASDEASQ